ncbi:hypothetical protein HNR60_001670 [Rhodopseudomonas rhenobacensis]|uniref:Uncharacterized protein n=1 Tax=Rhodopseudomonas rhenobacensis TaxID=87461 RepID=A0A7W7Z2T1_9BRAD|nr:hypothetical protein [Rhodopseudomonas rhenobacensis]MBB5046921.1 hypothetical protein [Rhodopseudomonas rhenobacensis]
MAASIGAISQVIVPSGDMLQVILHIIIGNGIGIAMPGMPMPGIPIIGIDTMGIICIAAFIARSSTRDETDFARPDKE